MKTSRRFNNEIVAREKSRSIDKRIEVSREAQRIVKKTRHSLLVICLCVQDGG